MNDKDFMRLALTLAKKGVGSTNPNPMVGAVIVKEGKVIGKGYHKKAGLPHAEAAALHAVNHEARIMNHGTTLYVTLEPCNTMGRTPPCTDAIIQAGIKRVVIATLDPNPTNYGKGVKQLKNAGIDVTVGVLEQEAQKLNEAFFTFHTKKRPFIAIKFASSLDGKISTHAHDSKWITNEKSRKFSNILRSKYQAVLVGINTILKDNPNLGTHSKTKPDPLRVIIDPKLKTPPDSQVLRDNNVLLITAQPTNKNITHPMCDIVKVDSAGALNGISLSELMRVLYKRNILSILVEGGGNTIGRFVDAGLFDKLYAFYAPILIGGQDATSSVGATGAAEVKDAKKLYIESIERIDYDILITAYPR